MKDWPALDVGGRDDSQIALAVVDDFNPVAVEELDDARRIFFAAAGERDAARRALDAAGFQTHALEVSDQDWARRSQEHLPPVTVGRVTVFARPQPLVAGSEPTASSPCSLVILPSTGFGTGHHATTRLCLTALQAVDLAEASVLDAGTGSGILAIAAALVGARRALGIDCDPDAIAAARENLRLNPAAAGVTFDIADLTTTVLPHADVVTANLSGTLLVRLASRLADAVRPGGQLIVSGLLLDEESDVRRAFSRLQDVDRLAEDEWVAMRFTRAV